MAHTTPRRSRHTSDKASHRLFHFILAQELSGFFFSRATNFADHNDRFGLGISEEHLKDVDKFRAFHRAATDAHSRGLAETSIGGLEHRFISERARARNNAH